MRAAPNATHAALRSLALAASIAAGCSPAEPECGPAPAVPSPPPATVTTSPPATVVAANGESAASDDVSDPVAAAVGHPDRPADDRARDADRKPADVLHLFGVAPGMTVADLMTGRGYYAELLARVVGPEGKVYAQNTPFVVQRFADQPLAERLAGPGLEHVVRLDRELEDPGLPAGELDVVLMVLFYHDTVWQKVDRTAMNRAIFAALKPGGVFGVVDHHAEAGSGERDVKTLHRVDAELVKQEILAAGFELDSTSDLLRHPEDDRSTNVFDESIRGKTDRFVYRFRKPSARPPSAAPPARSER